MDTRATGLIIAVVGGAVVLFGLLYAMGWLSWFGRLPGDIRYDGGNTKVYFPITTMILLSVGLSLVAYVIRRFF